MPRTDTKANSGHIPRGDTVRKDDVSGPVPRHHRQALGQDVIDDAQGVGRPSTKSTVQNTNGKGW